MHPESTNVSCDNVMRIKIMHRHRIWMRTKIWNVLESVWSTGKYLQEVRTLFVPTDNDGQAVRSSSVGQNGPIQESLQGPCGWIKPDGSLLILCLVSLLHEFEQLLNTVAGLDFW